MRILVTGVTGQVGTAVMRRFAGLGTLIPADRATLDLAKPNEIAARLDAIKPNLIINPAAYTAVDRAEDERELAFLVNAQAPAALARWSARHAIPLVHFSTDYVFDGTDTRPWREDDRTGPLGVYGASKLAGEEALREAGGPHLVIRTSGVYAAQGSNFLRTMARLAKERDELRVVIDQIGAPTSAVAIAEALAQIVSSHRFDLGAGFAKAGHLVHFSAAGETSWHGFAQAIVAGLRRRGVAVKARDVVAIASRDYPSKATRPLNSRLDLRRIEQIFGIRPRPWQDLLESELDQLAAMK